MIGTDQGLDPNPCQKLLARTDQVFTNANFRTQMIIRKLACKHLHSVLLFVDHSFFCRRHLLCGKKKNDTNT